MGDTGVGSSEGLCFLCFRPTLYFLDISKQHSNSYIFLRKYWFWPVTETKVTTCRDFFGADKRGSQSQFLCLHPSSLSPFRLQQDSRSWSPNSCLIMI